MSEASIKDIIKLAEKTRTLFEAISPSITFGEWVVTFVYHGEVFDDPEVLQEFRSTTRTYDGYTYLVGFLAKGSLPMKNLREIHGD